MQPSAVPDNHPTPPLQLQPLENPAPADNIPAPADPQDLSSVEVQSLPGQARGRPHVIPDQQAAEHVPEYAQAMDNSLPHGRMGVDQSAPQYSFNGAVGGAPIQGGNYAVPTGLQRITGEQGGGQQGQQQPGTRDKDGNQQESEQNIAHGGPGLQLSSADAQSTHADSMYGQSHRRSPPTGDLTSAGADSMHVQACPDNNSIPPKEFPEKNQKGKEGTVVKHCPTEKPGETAEHVVTTLGGGDGAGSKETPMESLVCEMQSFWQEWFYESISRRQTRIPLSRFN